MEWSDFPYSPLDESLYSLLSPPLEMPQPEWNGEENKIFEDALAEFDPLSPTFFEDIATKVPWRSVDEIRLHYQDLVQDLEMIESGDFPIPDHPTPPPPISLQPQNTQPPISPPPPPPVDNNRQIMGMQVNMEPRRPEQPTEGRTRHGQPRRRGVPWTEEEHQFFLMGLNKYGKGDWRSISRYYVITKTPTQVASHAQKYFRRQMSNTPVDRRRPSIHDIHTVNPVPPAAAFNAAPSFPHQFQFQYQQQQPFASRALIPNQLHHGFNAQVFNHNGGFLNNNNAPAYGVFNQMAQPAAAYAASSSSSSTPYFLAPIRNQHWGGM